LARAHTGTRLLGVEFNQAAALPTPIFFARCAIVECHLPQMLQVCLFTLEPLRILDRLAFLLLLGCQLSRFFSLALFLLRLLLGALLCLHLSLVCILCFRIDKIAVFVWGARIRIVVSVALGPEEIV
jgi:hypothetical protein